MRAVESTSQGPGSTSQGPRDIAVDRDPLKVLHYCTIYYSTHSDCSTYLGSC